MQKRILAELFTSQWNRASPRLRAWNNGASNTRTAVLARGPRPPRAALAARRRERRDDVDPQDRESRHITPSFAHDADERPNGTLARLPNEEFLTRSGRTFDGAGVPPHLTEPVFTKAEFDKKWDSAFDRAVNVLRNCGGTAH